MKKRRMNESQRAESLKLAWQAPILMAVGRWSFGIFPYTRVSNQAYIVCCYAWLWIYGVCTYIALCVGGAWWTWSTFVDYVYDWGANQPNVSGSVRRTLVVVSVVVAAIVAWQCEQHQQLHTYIHTHPHTHTYTQCVQIFYSWLEPILVIWIIQKTNMKL